MKKLGYSKTKTGVFLSNKEFRLLNKDKKGAAEPIGGPTKSQTGRSITGKSLRSLGTQSRAMSYAGSRRSSKWEEDSDTYWDE